MSGNKFIYKKNGFFKIENIKETKFDKELNINLFDQNVETYLKYDIIKYNDIKDEIKKDKAILKQCIDYDKISGEPVLRHKENGDKIRLSYRKVTKSLKKLFNEENLSIEDKKNILVISDDFGVIWVQDFGADQRVNVNYDTQNILFLYDFKSKDGNNLCKIK